MSFEIKELSKKFGDYTAVDNLSFIMEEPGTFGLLGTNGAGKTTTIRMILGMLSKDSGEIYWNGRVLKKDDVSIGYLAEERGIYSKIKIIEQLVYYGELRGMTKSEAKESAKYWLKRFGIEEYGKMTAEQLSKGNQQKIQFIAALISNPEIIILDEPLSGLDPVNANLFKEVIKEEVSKGKYVIMSSHQMSTIEEFCTELLILKKGKTILKGNLKDIKREYGRNNLVIKCDEDISEIMKKFDMDLIENNADYACYKIKNEESARNLLKELVQKDINVVKFELKEPTLHEIFINKVGEADEE